MVDPKISIKTGRDNGKVFLTITDNAGGIAKKVMEKIFEPYFTTKGPDQGTGIGLFHVQKHNRKKHGRQAGCP